MTVWSMEERRVWMNDGGNACLEDGGIANGENGHSGFLPSPGLYFRSATLS